MAAPIDAMETLGTIIGEGAKRDAIHIAVAPGIAGMSLDPGDHVGFLKNGTLSNQKSHSDCVGIVDPFLTESIGKGKRFWLFLYPRKITSLRHVWSHPAFPDEASEPEIKDDSTIDPGRESRLWILSFAASIEQTYDRLMAAAERWIDSNNDDYTWDNEEYYKDQWDKFPEFWTHYEIATGRKLPESVERTSFFTCSC